MCWKQLPRYHRHALRRHPAPIDAAVLQVGLANEKVAGVDEESSGEEEE